MAAKLKIQVREINDGGEKFLVFQKSRNARMKTVAASLGLSFDKSENEFYVDKPNKKGLIALVNAFDEVGMELEFETDKATDIDITVRGKLLQTARKLVEGWSAARENARIAKENEDKAKESLQEFLVAHGTKTKPGTDDSIMIVDHDKLQHQFNEKIVYDENAILEWARANKKKCPGVVTTIEVVDMDAFKRYMRDGKVPKKVLKTVKEKKQWYKLAAWRVGGNGGDDASDSNGVTKGSNGKGKPKKTTKTRKTQK